MALLGGGGKGGCGGHMVPLSPACLVLVHSTHSRSAAWPLHTHGFC